MGRAAGFTLMEMIVVIVVLGILAVTALPRLNSSQDFQGAAFRDQVAATLRYAQKTAVSHRRQVCASVSATGIALSISGAAACDTPLPGPDGQTPALTSNWSSVTLASSGAMLYFQPSGSVTNGGGVATDFDLTVSGQSGVKVYGATGHVE